MNHLGCVYWITGLAGAGKTTIGKMLYDLIKSTKNNVVFFDGDRIRKIMNLEKSYRKEERQKIAFVYSKLCKEFSDQGLDVVCCTISMFDDCRRWNKQNIKFYNEIYIKVPFGILKKRNQKSLYSSKKNVVGMDVEFEEPKNPSIILLNDGSKSLDELFDELREYLNLTLKEKTCFGTIQN